MGWRWPPTPSCAQVRTTVDLHASLPVTVRLMSLPASAARLESDGGLIVRNDIDIPGSAPTSPFTRTPGSGSLGTRQPGGLGSTCQLHSRGQPPHVVSASSAWIRLSHKLILRSPSPSPTPSHVFGHHVRQPCEPFDLCHYRLTGSDDRSSRPQIPTPFFALTLALTRLAD